MAGPHIIVVILFAMGCSDTKGVDSDEQEIGDSGEVTDAILCESLSGTVCRVAGTGSPGAIDAASLVCMVDTTLLLIECVICCEQCLTKLLIAATFVVQVKRILLPNITRKRVHHL